MIHMEPRHLEIVRRILETLAPEYEVRAFGSRVSGRNLKPFSDLDLVIMTDSPLPPGRMTALVDAFSESNLPIKVDVVDWATTSEEFRRIIEREYAVVRSLAEEQ